MINKSFAQLTLRLKNICNFSEVDNIFNICTFQDYNEDIAKIAKKLDRYQHFYENDTILTDVGFNFDKNEAYYYLTRRFGEIVALVHNEDYDINEYKERLKCLLSFYNSSDYETGKKLYLIKTKCYTNFSDEELIQLGFKQINRKKFVYNEHNNYEYDREVFITANGNTFEVDYLCSNVIKELNAKGYITHDCCSGHTGKGQVASEDGYIGFLIDKMPSSFPEFVTVNSDTYYFGKCKSININFDTYPVTESELTDKWNQMYEWSKKLKQYEYIRNV